MRSEATQRALLGSARELFGARGFAGTSLEEVVRHAGLTKGALYHHFAGKEALFLAVFEEVERDLAADVKAVAKQHTEPRERLRAGCHAFLQACLDRTVQQVVLLDAPSVLSWDKWRAIDSGHFAAMVRRGIEATVPEELRHASHIAPRVQVLRGALTEAALLVARSEDQAAMLAVVLDAVDDVLFHGVLPADVPALEVGAGSS
jgi:AcrR family transcriptional regulator